MAAASRSRASRQGRRNTTAIVVSLVVALVAALAAGALFGAFAGAGSSSAEPTETATPTPRPEPASTPTAEPVDTFDRQANSLDDPTSIWVVVNKLNPLEPANFVPPDLVQVPVAHTWVPEMRQEASDAIVAMFTAASEEAGLALASNSAYRSYDSQAAIYTGNDLLTARPGYSEHQTGLTMDIGAASGVCSLDVCLADTAEGIWLRDNAWRFGFILRYPADKTEVTGYQFEPWHFRYVGTDLSTEMHETGVTTLEEFFGLPAAPEYPADQG
ncbi:hypothetical protein ARHIZOSPH14_12140 [Agromyces rhizosphaerae]|uniref:D-alanyl-D-alanine carboxypeptidase-like core domain-containing protein n=1 Tax=Agromyces rhizosphaerae TaxID=88374 RepID=A0A9W6FQT9_9MICO|nr:M15 family metallopeptidase [Agromyces rhizosphaerae]GLI26972.1 hypothetical protein ARHIZOSPH14_12140 [Agromyces rhizosphaerae]